MSNLILICPSKSRDKERDEVFSQTIKYRKEGEVATPDWRLGIEKKEGSQQK